jgi:hypothetical protein
VTSAPSVTALTQRISASLRAPVDPAVAEFAARLARNSGAAAALFYGSNLRTGSLEGVLDFYLLMPGPQQEKIWPRVSYHEWDHAGVTLRAKVAAMALSTFAEAAEGERHDTTIWARFVQPSALVWLADDKVRVEVTGAIESAACTAARLAAALGPERGTAEDYWRALFQATYKAELRVEKPGREDSILSVNQGHFDGLLPLALSAQNITFDREGDKLTPHTDLAERKKILRWWAARRRLGKPLNLLRLIKATTTFEGAARYGAWKLERHTGTTVELTPWREKHPILAAPGVLFQLWRQRKP